MNFERGIDPKHTLHIGRWALASKVSAILEERISTVKIGNGYKEYIPLGKFTLSDKASQDLLEKLDGQQSVNRSEIRRLSFLMQEEGSKHHRSFRRYSGKDIIYKNKLYKIPNFHKELVSVDIAKIP